MRENLIRLKARLFKRLSRGRNARWLFVESQLAKDLSYQIRAMRDREDWNQAELARLCGTSQNAISRHENPEYGKPSLTSLKKIAAAFDVALVVRFVPFGELVDWVAGIPRTIKGLSETESLVPLSFAGEQTQGGLAARGSAALSSESEDLFYRPGKLVTAGGAPEKVRSIASHPDFHQTKIEQTTVSDAQMVRNGATNV